MKTSFCAAAALLLSVAAVSANPDDKAPSSLPGFKDMLTISDADGDGIVTREEFINARATFFPNFDKDGSGDLSKDEFVESMTEVIGSGFRARMAYGQVDSNGDGRLTLEEWNAIPPRAFDRADENEDGQLTPDEIEKV